MKKYDLIVAGGGLTGVAAAVSAAREGVSVLLVEQSGCLGGAMAGSLVYPFMPFWTFIDGKRRLLSDGIFTEMRNRTRAYRKVDKFGQIGFNDDGMCDFNTEHFKFALDEMVEEAGVDVLFHATLFQVKKEGRKLQSVLLATRQGVTEAEADFFIDCTGDGDLMAFAGCDFQLGRDEDGFCQPMTTCFRVANVDDSQLNAESVKFMQARYKQYREEQKIKNPRENILQFRGKGLGKGIVHFNTTRIIKHNPTDPLELSRAEMLARKQIVEMMNFLTSGEFPAFNNAVLVTSASYIGVRESRKLKGVHILTSDELMALTKFEDSIALGNYDIDIHNPAGTGTLIRSVPWGEYYTIPYRSMLPREFDNLLVSGRCISATHEAQSAIRIMPICATLGHAAGMAVAVAKNSGTNVHTLDVPTLRQKLRDNGAAVD